jgi:hypothetical protein
MMVNGTKAPARKARRDATRILCADHKKVSRIFAGFDKVNDEDGARKAQLMEVYGIEPQKIAPATQRQDTVQRHA